MSPEKVENWAVAGASKRTNLSSIFPVPTSTLVRTKGDWMEGTMDGGNTRQRQERLEQARLEGSFLGRFPGRT